MKYIALPFILLLIVFSCATQEVCNDDNQSYLLARFKTKVDGSSKDTIMTGINIFGIRDGREDSLLYDSVSASLVEIPLDPNNDFTNFVISNDSISDTLYLSHSSEVYLINYTCGFASRFILEQNSTASGWILELDLKDANVEAVLEPNEEHLWIYF